AGHPRRAVLRLQRQVRAFGRTARGGAALGNRAYARQLGRAGVKIVRRIFLGGLAVVIAAYAAVLGYMYVNQRALQYDTDGDITALSDAGITGAEMVAIPVGEGDVVNGWYAPPTEAGK